MMTAFDVIIFFESVRGASNILLDTSFVTLKHCCCLLVYADFNKYMLLPSSLFFVSFQGMYTSWAEQSSIYFWRQLVAYMRVSGCNMSSSDLVCLSIIDSPLSSVSACTEKRALFQGCNIKHIYTVSFTYLETRCAAYRYFFCWAFNVRP